jgi:hypothetical protein
MTLARKIKLALKDKTIPAKFTTVDLRNCKEYKFTENDIDNLANYDLSSNSTNNKFLKADLIGDVKHYYMEGDK